MHINMWLGMAIELVGLAGLMGGLTLVQQLHPMPAETSRKLFHIAGGLTTLVFPWLFSDALPVILLTIVTVPSLLAVKHLRALKSNLGTVLYRVERRSFGEVYFPLSVCLVFVFTQGNPLLFCIPVLLLTLADPAAAIIGSRYGHAHYSITRGRKSLEGSTAFLLVALACILVPMLLFTSLDPLKLFLVAGIIALLVMVAEAVAWEGLDNLLIPLVSFGLLVVLPGLEVDVLFIMLTGIVCILALVCLWVLQAAAMHRRLGMTSPPPGQP